MADPTLARAIQLLQAGDAASAEPLLRRAVQKAPGDAQANNFLAVALIQTGRSDQALFFARRAAAAPGSPPATRDTLGMALALTADHAGAAAAFRAAVAGDPTLANSHNGLGMSLLELGDPDGAAASLTRAVGLAPAFPAFRNQLAWALWKGWRRAEALGVLRAGVAAFPRDEGLRLQLASALNYVDESASEGFEHHRALGAMVERRTAQPARPSRDAPDPTRPLRIGLISPDLREHSVARFIEPLLAANTPAIEFHCYSATPKPDAVTARLRALAAGWRDIARMNDARAAGVVRADGIDILIDLAGHTIGGRLGVLAHRPAPVQMTWLGYPNTTGMACVDYRLVDINTDPPGSERWSTERLLRLEPCFVCYRPPAEAPVVSARPAGSLTFGSFNALTKLAEPTWRLWAGVLAAAPGSRLLLKAAGLENPAIRERVLTASAEAGIDPARVECAGPTATIAQHLAAYARVDIALDTFPYHGTTTTCEALWMGVPVVTLAGSVHAARVGVSLLTNAGLPGLIAADEAGYARAAAGLASDRTALAGLRASLRGRMAASPLCDASAFAAGFERACRGVYEAVYRGGRGERGEE